jgi:hypothetical protein
LFDAARCELKIKRGVVSMSNTWFGTVYWLLKSVLEGVPAFKRIAAEADFNGLDEDNVRVHNCNLIRLKILDM